MSSVVQIPLEEILVATNNFAEGSEIASGGFGKVYKGESEKHGIIAVKRLDRELGQGDHEFKTEIALLSEYKHENIVSLLGFCDEFSEKILVYKLETNGSLDKHLNNKKLTWTQRLRICLDAARGLNYLHDDTGHQHRVLHRDVKSANILLDENWNAKISDFGLSRIGPANRRSTFLITNACGTFGYIDPEYLITGYLTKESDVYSFGVVLFEVLCGRPTRVREYRDERQFLTVLVQKHYRRHTLDKIIYSGIQNQINAASLLTFSTIAYQCLKNGKAERPTMKQVVEKLEKALNNQLASSGSLSNNVYNGFSHGDDDSLVALQRRQHIGSSLASSSKSWNYDVYISFCGGTRHSLGDHLYLALVRREIHTIFMEDKPLSGDKQFEVLSEMIKESRIAIVIFSPDYAESSCCLDELAVIMKNKVEKGQIVMPLYFHVKPSEVRSQTDGYGEALAIHELNKNNQVNSWRKALVDATNLSGWDMANGFDSKIIREVVETVSHRLLSLMPSAGEKSAETSDDTDLIGIDTRTQELKSILKVGSGGVHMVGIYGIWGSGKSTLANSVYEEISHEFEGCCFVKNVRAESRMHGLKTLQEKIMSNVLKAKVTLKSTKQGTYMMERSLSHNNVLIVLDDVNHIDHLKMLAGSSDWFGDGSRIIITTRKEGLLNAHNVNIKHNVRMLDDKEAIKLFSKHAFGAVRPVKGYEEVSQNLVSKFDGHPSALISLGSFLHGKDMSEWQSILTRLGSISVDKILEEFKHAGDDEVTENIFSWLNKDEVTRQCLWFSNLYRCFIP